MSDPLLYEQHFTDSLNVQKFPSETTDLHVGTSAYHAERELDTLMYQDSGIYRNQQYARANAITLNTMYEEIPILWKEEVKYRPNFATTENVVSIPVIFSKVSGVKNGDINGYWSSIKELLKEDTYLITEAPHIEQNAPNPMKVFATEFFKNGKLQRNKIKDHSKLSGIILSKVISADFLVITLINDSYIRILDHSEMLITCSSGINIYNKDNLVILCRN